MVSLYTMQTLPPRPPCHPPDPVRGLQHVDSRVHIMLCVIALEEIACCHHLLPMVSELIMLTVTLIVSS